MDPNVTMAALLTAISEEDAEAANEPLQNMHEWLKKGGFDPSFMGGEKLKVFLFVTQLWVTAEAQLGLKNILVSES